MTTICALTVPSVVRPATAKRDVRARAFGGKKAGGVAAAVPRAGQTYADIGAAVDAGLLQASAPFEDGIDLFGFFKNIDQAEAQRYADVEITHGRLAMLASVGFIVGEQGHDRLTLRQHVSGLGVQPDTGAVDDFVVFLRSSRSQSPGGNSHPVGLERG